MDTTQEAQCLDCGQWNNLSKVATWRPLMLQCSNCNGFTKHDAETVRVAGPKFGPCTKCESDSVALCGVCMTARCNDHLKHDHPDQYWQDNPEGTMSYYNRAAALADGYDS